jgi:hypothetical protein
MKIFGSGSPESSIDTEEEVPLATLDKLQVVDDSESAKPFPQG